MQLPRQRALLPKLLLIVAGWIIAWLAFFGLNHDLLWELVGPLAEMIGLPWELIDIGIWAIRGIILGAIGGLFTGIALRWAEPSFRRVFGLAIGWAIVWGIGVATVPLTGLPFEGDVTAIVFWVILAAVAGLIGGALTGGALTGVSPFLGARGWPLGWGAALLVGEGIVQSGLADSWIAVGLPIGVIGGAIGGWITLALARRAQRRASA